MQITPKKYVNWIQFCANLPGPTYVTICHCTNMKSENMQKWQISKITMAFCALMAVGNLLLGSMIICYFSAMKQWPYVGLKREF